jgi:hypothetical protein
VPEAHPVSPAAQHARTAARKVLLPPRNPGHLPLLAGAGARTLPRDAIDGTLKCYPPGCYDGSHLRGSV